MGQIRELAPQRVFRFFEEICAIPHGSTNTKAISDYLVNFARQRGLRCIQDDLNNVIVFKDGTPGYEGAEPLLLQGHMDMVCETEPDVAFDFFTQGLELDCADGYVFAHGTTLGGDDGIALAYILAIFDADDIPHPPLEAVFTVDEEIGMLGAAAINLSPIRARKMLNIDSEEEGYLLTSCAGGVTAVCHVPVDVEQAFGTPMTVRITGLTGGHSGVEIHKGRANSSLLMGRLLSDIDVPYRIAALSGGLKDNAIPRETTATLLLADKHLDGILETVAACQQTYSNVYRTTDPNLRIELTVGEPIQTTVLTAGSARRAQAFLLLCPNGVQRMSADLPDLVETSLNLGILQLYDNEIVGSFSVRSSVSSEKQALTRKLRALCIYLGGTLELSGDYPAWEYRKDSPLRQLMVEVFTEQYGHPPVVQAIHAGVECGLFCGKLEGLDCISFGPDILDIHTTSERLSVASVQRTWNFLLEVLRRSK